jgi:nitrile hydratase
MPVLTADMVPGLVAAGASAKVDIDVPAKFKSGDKVRAKNINPVTHTRLPRYVRGKTGVVTYDHGVFVFNDTNAHGKGHHPQRVYNVRFTAQELWGAEASPRDTLCIDMFEEYIEPAAA